MIQKGRPVLELKMVVLFEVAPVTTLPRRIRGAAGVGGCPLPQACASSRRLASTGGVRYPDLSCRSRAYTIGFKLW